MCPSLNFPFFYINFCCNWLTVSELKIIQDQIITKDFSFQLPFMVRASRHVFVRLLTHAHSS